MKCPKCNSELPDKAKFCLECGSNISAVSGVSSVENKADISLSGLKTMTDPFATPPQPPGDMSIGDIRTVTGIKSDTGAVANKVIKDHYELQEEIGRGGFAVVYKGLDKKLTRVIAVKVLSAHAGLDNATVERFQRESSIIASLNHRNILAVYDCDRDDDTGYFIVMEYIEGGTLRDYLKTKGKLTIEDAVLLMRGICKGMSYAHRKNLVHRDIKPSNIMLTSDGDELVPKIVDFGLARSGGGSEVSISGFGMGTPFYMPPEQRRDAKSVNHTADIYAMGKVFYEMLTGEIPDNVDPKLIPQPAKLSDIIFKCIKSRPEERYFSVDELLADITLAMSGSGQASFVEKNTVTGVNVCPQCSTSNKPETKFCAKCGTGLTRNCPECDAESSIHDSHCPSCGTDIELFMTASSTLQKMEQYFQENKWSRVIKERSLLPEKIFLKGKKGTEILGKIKSLNWDAKNKQKKAKSLNDEIGTLTRNNDFNSALPLVDELLGITEDKASIEDLKVSVLADELIYRNDLYLNHIDSRLYQEALREGKRILEIIPQLKDEKIEGIEEIQESVGGLEQKLNLLANARQSVRVMRFFKTAGLIKQLEKYPEFKNEAAILKRGNLSRIYAAIFVACTVVFLVSLDFYTQRHNRQLFNSAMTEGEAAMQEKKFVDAETAFKKALSIKRYEKDILAVSSLQKVQDKIKTDIQKREDQKNKNEYDLAMTEGSKAISAENWAEAESAFKKALMVKGFETDSLASERLKAAQGGADYRKKSSEAATARGDIKAKAKLFLTDAKNTSLSSVKRCEAANSAISLLDNISSSSMFYLSASDKSEIENFKSEISSIKFKLVQIPAVFEMVKGAAADTNGLPQEIRHKTTGIEMVYVAPGEFMMGSPENEADRNPGETQHKVKLTKGYYIGKYEVTQKQYENVMGRKPSNFETTGKDAPVEQVSWDDCQTFCKKLGSDFRLPTEAEWEYAARGGNKSKGYIYSGSNNLDEVAWYDKNSGNKTHPVGQKKANELGIYDMSGNVWEWGSDWIGSESYTSESVTDPAGASTSYFRIVRGGSWENKFGGGSECRSASRNFGSPEVRIGHFGFRVVFSVR